MVCNHIGVCRRRVAEHLEKALPNLETLILTNNSIHELGDLDVLSTITSLRVIRCGCVLHCCGCVYRVYQSMSRMLLTSSCVEIQLLIMSCTYMFVGE